MSVSVSVRVCVCVCVCESVSVSVSVITRHFRLHFSSCFCSQLIYNNSKHDYRIVNLYKDYIFFN